MYDYIKGQLVELSPAEAIVECGGMGYRIMISLNTFTKLQQSGSEAVKLYLHHHLREEEEMFYGFFDNDERDVFLKLVSVSGIGPNSARMMLSAMSADEVRSAIISQDVNKIKSVKGIGLKTAQRVILELKDKFGTAQGQGIQFNVGAAAESPVRSEAASALVLLGFAKPAVEKALDKILKENSSINLEELIKKALKIL